MIARLKGKIIEKQPPFMVLDVNGVGYEIEAPLSTVLDLPKIGSEVALHVYMIVRDDAHLLFGFATSLEKRMFATLIKITGVGAKMALAILSGMSAAEFARCIRDKDLSQLVRVPGIGKKTAERLIVEAKDKLKGLGLDDRAIATGTVHKGTADNEALQALLALGYKEADARARINKVGSADISVEELIRKALKQ